MVLSYDYDRQKRRQQQTNAPLPQTISIAMVVHWCNTAFIAQWRRSRAFIKDTKCRHWATTCSVSPPAAARATANKTKMQNESTLLTVLMAVAVRRCYTTRIAWWRRFAAFAKATKCCHHASTCSNIIKETCLSLFQEYISSPNCWTRARVALITIGVWHINLKRST